MIADALFVATVRTLRMLLGQMTGPEAFGMVMEKIVAFTLAGFTGSTAPIEAQLTRNAAHYRAILGVRS